MYRRYQLQLNNLTTVELERLIDLWIRNSRNREITKDKLINGISFEALAEKYNLSVRQIKYIVYKSEDVIFNKQIALNLHFHFIVKVLFYCHNIGMKDIEFNAVFRKLVKDERLDDIPIMYIIRVFALLRDIIEEGNY